MTWPLGTRNSSQALTCLFLANLLSGLLPPLLLPSWLQSY